MVAFSPPYWGLRDYGVDGQVGLEPTPDAYIDTMMEVMAEVWRVLRDDGTCWVNLGDSYSGYKGDNYGRTQGNLPSHALSVLDIHGRVDVGTPQTSGIAPKNLALIPFRFALSAQQAGWIVRQDIIWAKPNPMPESVKDRPTTAHEHVFLLSKQGRYFYDADVIKEPSSGGNLTWGRRGKNRKPIPNQGYVQHREGRKPPVDTGTRNARSVWTIATQPYPEAHFATWPERLVERMVKAGCPDNGIVLDPFVGSGTTVKVARELGRRAIGLDLSMPYLRLAQKRNAQMTLWEA
jgi:DNA modification methylase